MKRWKTYFDLRANLISTKVSASHRKSTQVHESPGQTESQVDPSFTSTCEYVWPGLKNWEFATDSYELVYLPNLEWYVVLWRKIRKNVDFAWHRRKYAFVIRKRTLNADFHIIARCHGTGCPGWYDRKDILFHSERCSYRYTMAKNGIWWQRSLRF